MGFDAGREDGILGHQTAAAVREFQRNTGLSVDGILGPAIAGAPRPLLEARILRAEYPAGYTPKRATRAMPPLPFLEPEIPYLEAYLAAVAPAPAGD